MGPLNPLNGVTAKVMVAVFPGASVTLDGVTRIEKLPGGGGGDPDPELPPPHAEKNNASVDKMKRKVKTLIIVFDKLRLFPA